jgi:hypothetical protein
MRPITFSAISTITTRWSARAGLCVAIMLLGVAAILPVSASAGTYPMHQCATGVPAVSPGWSVFAYGTSASTVLTNTCSTGGRIGDYVFTNGQPGAVTENGSSGSQVGLQIGVPASVPGVTIQSIEATVIASSVTGDDAFLGFASAGQGLPGGVELPYGDGSPYTTSETWTLPQDARDFEAYVNCSTDRSSTTCEFTDSTEVPALTNITLTLEDDTPPKVEGVSGTLAAAAASGAPVTGSQAISFSASDAQSGVRSVTLTLDPLNGANAYVHTFDYSKECAYDAWNACPATETVSGFAVNTGALAYGTYAVSLTITDAAANTTNDALGSVTVPEPPAPVVSPAATPSAGASPAPGPQTAGSPNGTRATEGAHLQLGGRSAISRKYAKRALRIAGRLLNAQGLPITGATLDVLQQVDGATLHLIGHTQTSANGTFVANVPGGPSRTIEIAYRAFEPDSAYTATVQLRESVPAGVTLFVRPRRTSSQGKITLHGRVRGPLPPGGVVVELLVHYRGHWVPFRTARTNGHGHFHVTYQFEGGVGRFPFRALVFAGQSGFPFNAGRSRVVGVRTSDQRRAR